MGNILWVATWPAGTEGIPAMYEVHGREYLVVPAASAKIPGRETTTGARRQTLRYLRLPVIADDSLVQI
jgi:hypothetical protein